jgi:hypothetical protein
LGQNKVAYRKSASWVAWKCLKSDSGWVVVVVWCGPTHYFVNPNLELGCDKNLIKLPLCPIWMKNIYHILFQKVKHRTAKNTNV